MAVPTVIRLLPFGASITDPVEGPTAGRQALEVYGNNFRLPDATPVTPQPVLTVAPVPRSVSVTFGGVEAVEVEVVTSIKLRVLTPVTPIGATVVRMAGAPALTFADVDPDTIIRDAGSWLDDGLFPGQLVTVAGTASNDGGFLVADVTALVLTLDAGASLTAEGPVADATVVSRAVGEGTVDVVVTNLDDNEVPIGGETITLPDAYTYRRPRLDHATQHDLVRLVRKLIREFKRQVLPEVVLTDSTDFDVDTVTSFVEIAQLPAIVLLGPDIPENRFYSLNETPEEDVGDNVVEIRRQPHTVDVLFDVVGITDSKVQSISLMANATQFMQRNPTIFLDRDPDDPGAGQVEYEFDFQPGGGFESSLKPSKSNLRTFSGSIVIRGFDIEGFSGFARDAVRNIARDLPDLPTSIVLDVETL